MAPRSRSKASVPVNKPPAPAPAPVNKPLARAPDEGEEFDFGNVSSSDDEDNTGNPAPTRTQATRAGGAIAPGNQTTYVAPITKPVVKSNRALNVDLIFGHV
jgi:hypothetical protein